MAYEELTVTTEWPEAAQYTASGETEIRLVNPAEYDAPVYWITAASKPTLSVARGSPIPIGGVQDTTLADAEKLWLAAPQADGSMTVTLMV